MMQRRFRLNIIPLLTVLATLTAMATFLGLSGNLLPFELSPQRIWQMLLLNVLLMTALAFVIGRKVMKYWANLRDILFKSKLQRRIVWSFALIAILPTVIVSLFSALFFSFGIQAWFNDRVNTAVQESLAVAEAYLNEHRDNIRMDALGLAADINRFSEQVISNPLEFNRFISAQAERRQLTEVVVFQRNRIIAQGRLSFTLAFESLPQDALERASGGDIVILQGSGEEEREKVRALIKIDSMPETYLLVGRLVDEKVISHMVNTQGAYTEYRRLKDQLSRLQTAFSGVFLSLTLVLLMAASWYGLIFSTSLTTPIVSLATAAERVRAGDYSGRVEAGGSDDEVSTLTRTFNRMVEQLDMQRSELISANRELDERRRFSEAVLGGVSAGVVALDEQKRITLLNRSAATILTETQATPMKGRHISEIIPGIQEMLVQADAARGEVMQGTLTVPDGTQSRTLHVRVTVEYDQSAIEGYIVTFDDITPLVAAQRTAAWSDVARRVAHEIKNPLTPIALSAERLRRKYAKYIEEAEMETFTKYLDTIARHVGDIGRMVEEFVSFARMPGVVMKEADLVQIIKKSLFSEQVAHPGIQYKFTRETESLPFQCDERQLSQVLTNLLKNAAEAIEGAQIEGQVPQGAQINVSLEREGEHLRLDITDNGPGFPEGRISSLTDPYVTTRAKGTGLGLAIVKKIVEEHEGTLTLANRPEGGARVSLSFLQQCDIKTANTLEESA